MSSEQDLGSYLRSIRKRKFPTLYGIAERIHSDFSIRAVGTLANDVGYFEMGNPHTLLPALSYEYPQWNIFARYIGVIGPNEAQREEIQKLAKKISPNFHLDHEIKDLKDISVTEKLESLQPQYRTHVIETIDALYMDRRKRQNKK